MINPRCTISELKRYILNDFIHPQLKSKIKFKLNTGADKNNPFVNHVLSVNNINFLYLTTDWTIWTHPDSNETLLCVYDFIDDLKKYEMKKHYETSSNTKRLVRILTLLDRRTGKRTLKKFINNGDFFKALLIDNDKSLVELYKASFIAHNLKFY